MSETQDAQIRNTIPDNIAKPLSTRFVRIFRNSSDGNYYGKKIDNTIELIGGPNTIGRFFATSNDNTLGFANQKLIAGANVTFDVVDLGGGNLALRINSTGGSGSIQNLKLYLPKIVVQDIGITPFTIVPPPLPTQYYETLDAQYMLTNITTPGPGYTINANLSIRAVGAANPGGMKNGSIQGNVNGQINQTISSGSSWTHQLGAALEIFGPDGNPSAPGGGDGDVVINVDYLTKDMIIL